MKNISSILLAAMLILVPAINIHAATNSNIPKEILSDLRPIIDLHSQSVSGDNVLWEDYSPLSIPVQLYFDGVGTVLINHPYPGTGYGRVMDIADSSIPIYFRAGGNIENIGLSYSEYVDAGVRVAFVNNYSADKMGMFVHEVFHYFQNKHFVRPRMEPCGDGGFIQISPATLAGMYLEQLMLAKALLFGGERDEFLQAFVALRTDRYLREGKCIRQLEEYKERIEGSAQYVERKALWSESQRRRMCAEVINDFLSASSAELLQYYTTGEAQMLLLEAMPGNWQKEIAQGKSAFEALRKRVDMQGIEIASLAAKVRKRYDFESLLKTATGRVWAEAEHKKDRYHEFKSARQKRIRIKLCGDDVKFLSYHRYYASPDDKRQFSYELNESEYYSPRSGRITVSNTMMEIRETGSGCVDADVLFAKGEMPEITLDGSTRVAGAYVFNRINVDSKALKLSLTIPGTASLSQDGVSLVFKKSLK